MSLYFNCTVLWPVDNWNSHDESQPGTDCIYYIFVCDWCGAVCFVYYRLLWHLSGECLYDHNGE